MEKEFLKEVYYALFNAEKAVEYTYVETNKFGVITGTYGPWHKIPSGKIKHKDYKGN
jgi:hypothetical protein